RSPANRTGRYRGRKCNGHFGTPPSWRRPGRSLTRERPAVDRATRCRAATSGRTGHSSKGYREQPKVLLRAILRSAKSQVYIRGGQYCRPWLRKKGRPPKARPALNRLENQRTFPPKRPSVQPASHDGTICAKCGAVTVLCDTAQLRD